MARKATVPTPSSGGVPAEIAAQTTTTPYPADSTGIGPNLSESQPPTGRISTATTTNPAIRFAASAAVSPWAVLR